ncbi:hypothetical protein OG497_37940 [Streptomyces sp. NBC_01242]|uniref:hypothetical protein n=1 Tax=Streptomyces sp. NBC_01242 TaxID=2903795 RepID=UPI00225B159B|nr:hypothetical protein [Streptomyces sp. NBC_01242]MCX4799641.1 hypothetical protein [Streptomyces sp. NBC_01242]
MPKTCGAPHPEHPDISCDREAHQMAGFHRNRATGTVWAADSLPETTPTGRGALASMAVRTTRSTRTGPPADAVARWAATTKENEDR